MNGDRSISERFPIDEVAVPMVAANAVLSLCDRRHSFYLAFLEIDNSEGSTYQSRDNAGDRQQA